MSDDFNMSMRKFLKQVGVTSQQAIEKAAREAGSGGLYEGRSCDHRTAGAGACRDGHYHRHPE